mmetsp:Transcript_14839/g.37323  ORF Transcript_14839/g.37323 Transcript_14839/m.37323 type:complete len:322 (-) Transcript_14839:536-1501(-)
MMRRRVIVAPSQESLASLMIARQVWLRVTSVGQCPSGLGVAPTNRWVVPPQASSSHQQPACLGIVRPGGPIGRLDGVSARKHIVASPPSSVVTPSIATWKWYKDGPPRSRLGVARRSSLIARQQQALSSLIAMQASPIGSLVGMMPRSHIVARRQVRLATRSIAPTPAARGPFRSQHSAATVTKQVVLQPQLCSWIAMRDWRVGRHSGLRARRSIAARKQAQHANRMTARRGFRTPSMDGQSPRSFGVVTKNSWVARPPPLCSTIVHWLPEIGTVLGPTRKNSSAALRVLEVSNAIHSIVLPVSRMDGLRISRVGVASKKT